MLYCFVDGRCGRSIWKRGLKSWRDGRKKMRKKHHEGQKHLSGKELLEKRREERELSEKQMRERKEDDGLFIRVHDSYPASLFMNARII